MLHIKSQAVAVAEPDAPATERLVEMFRLLGERNRLLLVYACLERPLSVRALADQVDISVSLASHHLRLLRAARLVRAKRRGKQIFYVAADAHVERVLKDMASHSGEAQL